MSSINLNWEEFLNVDSLSLEDERNTSVALSDYMSKQVSETNGTKKKSIDFEKIKVFYLSRKLNELSVSNFSFDRIEKDELINRLNNQIFIDVNPTVPFPRVNDLELLFAALRYLAFNLREHVAFRFSSDKYKYFDSEINLVNALVYLGYLNIEHVRNYAVYIPTDSLISFANKKYEEQYFSFITELTKHKAIKECLMVQFYSSSFDTITKEIMKSKIGEDLSISHEKLSEEELEQIVKNMRTWFLSIKKHFLKN